MAKTLYSLLIATGIFTVVVTFSIAMMIGSADTFDIDILNLTNASGAADYTSANRTIRSAGEDLAQLQGAEPEESNAGLLAQIQDGWSILKGQMANVLEIDNIIKSVMEDFLVPTWITAAIIGFLVVTILFAALRIIFGDTP